MKQKYETNCTASVFWIKLNGMEMDHPVYRRGIPPVSRGSGCGIGIVVGCRTPGKDAGATRAAYGALVGNGAPFFAGIKCEPMPR